MKAFAEPMIEIAALQVEDVITTSFESNPPEEKETGRQ